MHYFYPMEGYPGDVQNCSEPNCFESILEREETYVSGVHETEFINVMKSIEYTDTCEQIQIQIQTQLDYRNWRFSSIRVHRRRRTFELEFKFKFNSTRQIETSDSVRFESFFFFIDSNRSAALLTGHCCVQVRRPLPSLPVRETANKCMSFA